MSLHSAEFDSPLGTMLAIANDQTLYLLEFIGRRGLKREIERLQEKMQGPIVPGWTDPIHSIQQELEAYFKGRCTHFQTPFEMLGTPFQQRVWKELLKIPFGETRSYLEIAQSMGKPTAFRAVANANGTNQLAIVIPCHRVINSNGKLGGYGGGIPKKEWLLKHEKVSHES